MMPAPDQPGSQRADSVTPFKFPSTLGWEFYP
jgi:hypothetical protein